MTTPAEQWAADLAAWAVPQYILDQVDTPPWLHAVEQFTPPNTIPDSLSHQRAREAVPAGGSVLDVGSGGGRASMALVPPATHLVAVDSQQGMLDVFSEQARQRGIEAETHLGAWPDVAAEVPACDVVVCHHVAYNVPLITPFLLELNTHAARRVVLELPILHPQSAFNPLWKRFWDIDRPDRPTANDLLAVAIDAGLPAHMDVWVDEEWGNRVAMSPEKRVAMARTRLCLPPERDAEVAVALAEMPEDPERRVATLWWDVAPA